MTRPITAAILVAPSCMALSCTAPPRTVSVAAKGRAAAGTDAGATDAGAMDPAAAGPSAADTLRLGLGAAITMALEVSEEVQAAKAQLDLASSLVVQSRSAVLPQLNAGLTYTRQFASVFESGQSGAPLWIPTPSRPSRIASAIWRRTRPRRLSPASASSSATFRSGDRTTGSRA
jgi:outer membrane protein TolC